MFECFIFRGNIIAGPADDVSVADFISFMKFFIGRKNRTVRFQNESRKGESIKYPKPPVGFIHVKIG
jgi:hypothetical protein